jgi:single-stranded-DNA-specific exonuclease
MTRILPRPAPARAVTRLIEAGTHPLLARIYAARGIESRDELDYSLKSLLPPARLKGVDDAARLLADAIEAGARMVIVADYDCDGATACAVGIRALRAFGADVGYLVPNRFEYGYGLTPAIVELATGLEPEVLITVDNGIASVEGVAAARDHGIATVITDHHLPGDELPEADVIVNPNQPGCDFPSKALAGVGVMFYTMLALRAELRERGAFAARPNPTWPSSSTSSRWAPSPTWSSSTTTTASWWPRASSACAPTACSRASARCSRRPAATPPAPPASTWASPSARASTPPAAWPTCRWASNA